MATQVQIRRGTAAECDAFTGAVGELFYDTTNKALRLSDGATAGGIPAAGSIPNAESVIYVGKNGSDANSGRVPHKAKLTIAAAITAAVALAPPGVKARVEVLDAGAYSENLTLSPHIFLYAPAATLIGTLSMDAGARASLWRHYSSTDGTTLVSAVTSSGEASFYHAAITDGRGTGGVHVNNDLFFNNTAGRVLFVACEQAYVPQGGRGVRDGSAGAGFGHVHFNIRDLYLAGNNAQGVRAHNANAYLVGFIEHILEIGTPTGTVGVTTLDAAASVMLVAAEIVADTAYDVSGGGSLYLACPKVTGARTGAAVHDSSLAVRTTGGQTLTGGVDVTEYDAGTKSSGTFTPDPKLGNLQRCVNGGAHTLAVPSTSCSMVIQVTNNSSAGAITPSGFTFTAGDTLTTTNGDDFLLFVIRVGSFSLLYRQKLQ